MSLIVELNASANVLYLLKHILLLNLVIFNLKFNNLIFNEIMVLNALYVCLLQSRFIEDHPIWILENRPLIFEVVLPHALSPQPPLVATRTCGRGLVTMFEIAQRALVFK
jgi:hypothetical protein